MMSSMIDFQNLSHIHAIVLFGTILMMSIAFQLFRLCRSKKVGNEDGNSKKLTREKRMISKAKPVLKKFLRLLKVSQEKIQKQQESL